MPFIPSARSQASWATFASNSAMPADNIINTMLSDWDNWAAASEPGSSERRDLAVLRVRECSRYRRDELDLSNLGLRSLPDSLPSHVEVLHLNNNLLTHLPEQLPSSLLELHAQHNRLTHLPLRLPASLQILHIDDTPSIATSNALRDAVRLPGPAIPPRHSSVPSPHDILKAWYAAPADVAYISAWKKIVVTDPDATDFMVFLARLTSVISNRHADFSSHIRNWLISLLNEPELRKQTMIIAQTSSNSCNDKVSLALIQMQNCQLGYELNAGRYDQHLPDFIGKARDLFRQESLESIAREKIKELNRSTHRASNTADEVEVYLGYLVKLRENLRLMTPIREMSFFMLSELQQTDLNRAEESVKRRENTEFTTWLADWAPWQQTMRRIAPEQAAQTERAIQAELALQFESRVDERMQSMQLSSDSKAYSDARIAYAAILFKDIKTKHWEHATQAYFEKNKLAHLLKPMWLEASDA